MVRLLGRGGMGEVYLAQDTRLDRKVALKLLSPQFASDAERVLRFTQEARAASALNHPNIITIYDIGDAGGSPYIATEFIDGETLRQKLSAGRLPVAQALEYALQTANALAAAHQAGITHRDIKPENIMVRSDGYVKVVDFGLAKLAERAANPQDSGTVLMSPAVTTCGTVMGTAQYMSPEQARGVPVDARSDIFSMGVVMYEMLAGCAPFSGETASHSIVAVLERDPLPISGIPSELQHIVSRCLAKDIDQRYQSAAEMVADLKTLMGHSGVSMAYATGPAAAPVPQRVSARQSRMWLAVPIIVLAAAAAWFGYTRLRPASVPFQNYAIEDLTDTGKVRSAVISPDGRYVVFTQSERGLQSLHIKQVVAGTTVQIQPAGPQRYAGLSFSRDGNYLFFVRMEPGIVGSTLYRISSLGGEPQKIADGIYSAVSFSPDGERMAYQTTDGTFTETRWTTARLDGSDAKTLKTTKPPILTTTEPVWSPDGKWIACSVSGPSKSGYRGAPVLVPVNGGPEKTLGPARWGGLSNLAWTPDSKALLAVGTSPGIVTSTQIWYIPVSGGEPRQVTNDVSTYATLSSTADGKTLLTVKASVLSGLYSINVSDPANVRPIVPPGLYYAGVFGLSWSPDGKLTYSSKAGSGIDLMTREADEGAAPKRLTNDNAVAINPSLADNGRKIFFTSTRVSGMPHVWELDVAGGDLRQITTGSGEGVIAVTADGKEVLYGTTGGDGVWKMPADGGTPVHVITSPTVASVAISPDGQNLAVRFLDQAAGRRMRIGVMAATGGDYSKVFDPATPSSGGVEWTPDGSGLTYVGEVAGVGQLWLQPLAGGPARQLTHFTSDRIFSFAWSHDGKQVAVARGVGITDAVLIREKN